MNEWKLIKSKGITTPIILENDIIHTSVSLGKYPFKIVNILASYKIDVAPADEWNISINNEIARELSRYTMPLRTKKSKVTTTDITTDAPKEEIEPINEEKQKAIKNSKVNALDVLLGLAEFE